MNKLELLSCLERIDKTLKHETTLKTVSPAKLIASKLIRYDEIDRSDIQYLYFQYKIDFSEIEAPAKTLIPPFNRDPIVLDNLENLKADMQIWNEEKKEI